MDAAAWDACVRFHGHECPGLAIGFRAAQIAQEHFGRPVSAATDEQVVCVTENDACGVDAVQVMTGCTVGKGNLVFRPTGKMAFTFFERDAANPIRIVLRDGVGPEDRREKMRFILEAPVEDVFSVGSPAFGLPETARLFASEVCEQCGEAAPEHKIRIQNGQKVCLDCFEAYERGW